MKLSNDVEKYEIEVTKMGQTTHCFLEWTTRRTISHVASELDRCIDCRRGNKVIISPWV